MIILGILYFNTKQINTRHADNVYTYIMLTSAASGRINWCPWRRLHA